MNYLKLACSAVWLYARLSILTKYKKGIKYNKSIGNYEEERKNILGATTSWGNDIVKHYDINVDVEGLDNIPDGPVLFVSNHQGFADIAVYFAAITTKQFGFVAKKALGDIPLFGPWILRIRSLFLEREDARGTVEVMNKGVELLKDGFSLVIFPEGTRSKSSKMDTFKKGSLKLATKAQVPIVPITLNGSWRIFEEGGFIRKGMSVKFFVHPAVETKDLSKQETRDLSENIEAVVRNKLEEWNGTAQ